MAAGAEERNTVEILFNGLDFHCMAVRQILLSHRSADVITTISISDHSNWMVDLNNGLIYVRHRRQFSDWSSRDECALRDIGVNSATGVAETGVRYAWIRRDSYCHKHSNNIGIVSKVGEMDNPNERGKWARPAEFILATLGSAVGLGNIWRFPYMCFENGGGAFLIPYVLMLILVGVPMFFVDLILGQYSGRGPIHVWELAPLFQGIGVGIVTICAISSVYYNMVIGWALHYMFASWQSRLPWEGCQSVFNTPYCYSKREAMGCESSNGTWFNQTCYNVSYIEQFNDSEAGTFCNTSEANGGDVASCWNYTYNPLNSWLRKETSKRVSASEEYYSIQVLDRSPSIGQTGGLKWDLVLCLLLAWILCYFCIIKGIKSAGKVMYFTATFPYLMLTIMLIRGVMLEGALEGIKFYIIPTFDKLSSPKIWVDAAGQIFYSLGVGFGCLQTLSSYNKFHNNIYRDTMIVCSVNCLTSFLAGFVVFSILGYQATVLGKTVDEIARSGSGLAFITYPEVVTWLDPPQLWATLFFFMILTLGIDTQFAGVENIMTALFDVYPVLRRQKPLVSGLVCLTYFILGLTTCTRAGSYWVDLMSYYATGWSLVLIVLCQAMVVFWVFGTRRLMDMVEEMLGFRLKLHWWICWTFISPILLIVILISNMIAFAPLSYGDYVLGPWAQALGWLMALASVFMIPVLAIYRTWRSYKDEAFTGLTLAQRIKKLTRPSRDWKTSLEKDKIIAAKQAADSSNAEDYPDYGVNNQMTKV